MPKVSFAAFGAEFRCTMRPSPLLPFVFSPSLTSGTPYSCRQIRNYSFHILLFQENGCAHNKSI